MTRELFTRNHTCADRQTAGQTACDTGPHTRAAAVTGTVSWARAVARWGATGYNRAATVLLVDSQRRYADA